MSRFLSSIKAWWRFIAAVALPMMLVAFLMTRAGSLPVVNETINALQDVAGEWWAVPLFFVVYAAFAVLLLPVGLLSIVAAVAWGWKAGGAIELVACTAAAVIPFTLAQGRAAAWVKRRLARSGGQVPSFSGSDGTFILLLLRIVPLIPYVALNYLAGLARVRRRDFILTTALGSIPSVFVFAYFVDTMTAGAMGIATHARILGACVAVAILAIIGRVLARRVAARLR